jgi:hypothetical protein
MEQLPVDDKKWEELRKPFPKESVGLLPQPYKKDSAKGKCSECGGWHGLPAMHLDYVGHAAVTDRLNTIVGPDSWSLDPMAVDDLGNPQPNHNGELWCWLTILGTRKMCVGDGSSSSKQLIGDALRNGAMRFGIALDLWSKEELESAITAPELANDKPSKAALKPAVGTANPQEEVAADVQRGRIKMMLKAKGIDTKAMPDFLEKEFGVTPGTILTKADAEMIIEELQARSLDS